MGFAQFGHVNDLSGMTQLRKPSSHRPAARGGAFFNTAVIGLGGLYASTRSLPAVVVVGLIAAVAVYVTRTRT